jgi:hypothetical protein
MGREGCAVAQLFLPNTGQQHQTLLDCFADERILFPLGNLVWKNQQYQETLAVYTQGLKLNPTHPYAKQNLQEVKAQLQKTPQPSPAASP